MVNRIRRFQNSGKIQDGRQIQMPSPEEQLRLEELRKALDLTLLDLTDPSRNTRNDNVGLNQNIYDPVHVPKSVSTDVVLTAVGMTPVVGDAIDLAEAAQQFKNGNYGLATAMAATLAIPNTIEKPFKWMYRVVNKNKRFGGRFWNRVKRFFGWKPSLGELYSNLIGTNMDSDAVILTKRRLFNGGFNRLLSANNIYYSPEYRRYIRGFNPTYDTSKNLKGNPLNGGVAIFNKKAEVFTDNPYDRGEFWRLTDTGSHEFTHFLGDPSTIAFNLLDGIYDFNNIKNTTIRQYLSSYNGTELAARGNQLKNFFNLGENDVLTGDHLRYAAKYYSKDTGINNNMNDFFRGIKDYDKFAKWLNWTAPLLIGGIAATLTDSYKLGGTIKRRIKL